MEKIIFVTHGGIFHADEVLAAALVAWAFHGDTEVCVMRGTGVNRELLSGETIMTVDVGGEYDPAKLKFDHHQDVKLPASSTLVLDWLASKDAPKNRIQDLPSGTTDIMKKRFFIIVSNRDTHLGCHDNEDNFTRIIRDMNDIPNTHQQTDGVTTGWGLAVDIAKWTLEGLIHACKKITLGEKRFHACEKCGTFFINRGEFITGWQELAKKEGITFKVLPSRDNPTADESSEWAIMSRDGINFPIPKNDTQKFIHNSKFFAVYASLSDALAHVKTL